MSAKSNNFKIGLFVLLAITLMVGGLLAFGAKSYFTPKIKFETAIRGEVSGLSIGSGVQLRGVPIGQVTRITFTYDVYPKSTSGMIIVEFEIESHQLPLPIDEGLETALKGAMDRGLRAMVKSQGITGTSILALEYLNPHEYPPLAIDYAPRYHYVPSAPAQFARMLESIEESLRDLQKLDFAGIGRGVTNTLSATTRLVEHLNQIDTTALSTNANALLVEVRGLSSKVQATVDKMQLENVSRNASELLSGLRDTNTKLQAALDNLGTVPLDDTLADVRETLQTLNGVLLDLKQYPSGFIFGEPPRPTTAVQRTHN